MHADRKLRLVFIIALVACLAGCGEDEAKVRFFLDVNSKAPEPGYELQYIFVIWNEGRVAAENVTLPVPLEQLEPYEHLTHLRYVNESMSINKEYHPDTSNESYYFVSRAPLTDAEDGDDGHYNETAGILYFNMARMEPDDYVVWAFSVTIDTDAICENNPLMQNWVTISADNSDAYENDIIGHIVCESPKLRAVKECDRDEAAVGDEIIYTITYSLDEIIVEDKPHSRFDVQRVRIYDTFPSEYLEIVSIGNDGEQHGGSIFWQIDRLENGGSGSVHWTARIKSGISEGAVITNNVEIISQNTVPEQNINGGFTIQVIAP